MSKTTTCFTFVLIKKKKVFGKGFTWFTDVNSSFCWHVGNTLIKKHSVSKTFCEPTLY